MASARPVCTVHARLEFGCEDCRKAARSWKCIACGEWNSPERGCCSRCEVSRKLSILGMQPERPAAKPAPAGELFAPQVYQRKGWKAVRHG